MKTSEKQTKSPAHLKPDTRRWWDAVNGTYTLEDHHRKLLTLAAEAWDRARQAREKLDRDGLTYTDRFGSPKARPEVNIERDCRVVFARLLRELALDIDPPAESRPPTTKGAASLRKGG